MTIQRDKIEHLAVGLIVALTAYALTHSLPWTWSVTIALALAKEGFDATGRGHVEYRDFIATVLPACVPTILAQTGLTTAACG